MFLTSRQIFDCFCVSGLYDPVWDLLRDRCANDDDMYGPEWFYAGIHNKLINLNIKEN